MNTSFFFNFRAKYQEIGLSTWLVYLQRGFQDTIMIHENDIGRVDLSPDYLTLCNRYFIRETSLQTVILDEKSFGVPSYVLNKVGTWIFFQILCASQKFRTLHNFICFHKNFEVSISKSIPYDYFTKKIN